jgi:hypothetical protein
MTILTCPAFKFFFSFFSPSSLNVWNRLNCFCYV